ncbi:HD domain-containing protein [Candidatus Dojkabacteria bacterium]|uniref:HD domain-containing protein n=1 Tax=Candidatus Dojkabacteria bacterium TaxID=2099670 RepID=A0A3M0Z1R5_9BACT|nr:MAG: HD domain-containing protein [Candidatus Dojkabacteria bacterium]
MKSIYVKDLKKNTVLVGEVFLVSSHEKSKDKNGKEYYKLVLSDKTGKIDGRIWSDSLENVDTNALADGKLVAVNAKVEEYKGQNHLIISYLKEINESKLDEFIQSSIYDTNEMYAELMEVISKIKNKALRNVLRDIFSNDEISRKFKYWPAARSVHHDFRSGMLQHVLEMIEIAKSMMRFFPEINFDVLVAGIILHDIGKIEELEINLNTIDYSKVGSLYGHVVIGALIFESYANKHPELDNDLKLHVTHLILSHHGAFEYGAPVLPSTLEAICLHYIDNLSSKARLAASALKNKDEITGFTDHNKWLGVMLWDGGNTNVSKAEHDEKEMLDLVKDKSDANTTNSKQKKTTTEPNSAQDEQGLKLPL